MASRKIPKVAKVKTPTEIQITAEQLLREAKETDLEILPPPPKRKISDPEELADYLLRKRKQFEDNIRKNRSVISNWIKYAEWEESQKQIQRARSVYERALDVEHRNITLWLKYAEMEMRNRQVQHARNIWDRAVTILPRANQFWYKYTYMEEMLGNIAGARQVFERWIEWEPEEQAWLTFIKFELRYKEIDRARMIFERFEEIEREPDRVRAIYKYALDNIPKENAQELFKNCTIHDKKYDDRADIEDVIVSKRKFKYEEEIKANPSNYDGWFDYLRLVENKNNIEVAREVYERAVANIPPTNEKRFWRRYIYLWINYAIFEELKVGDVERTREVYKTCLQLIPHKHFTFAKIWLLFAQFEIRQKNLSAARKILGTAIGKCPKIKLFRGYIELEIQLREFDRCRILYEKFLEFGPENCTTWIKMEAGWEEYFDYTFPSDEAAQPNLKLLAIAKRWKQEQKGTDEDDE